MKNKNENMTNKLKDKELEDVAGGLAVGGRNENEIEIYTDNSSTYSSGDTPKYAVGQELKIRAKNVNYHYLTCSVLGVSETKTGGLICKEFVYRVKITAVPNAAFEAFVGKVYNGVYESCLYE